MTNLQQNYQMGDVPNTNYTEIEKAGSADSGSINAFGTAKVFSNFSNSVELSADYDFTLEDQIGGVLMDTTAAARTSKLPALVGSLGRVIDLCKDGANNYTVDGDGALINGSPTIIISSSTSGVRLRAFASEWRVI